MLTSRTDKERVSKWQLGAAMYQAVYASALSLASVSLGTNIFGGRLGQEMPIDSRHIRH